MFDRTDEMRADARMACVDLVLLCIVVTMLCSVAVHSYCLECPGEKWFGGGGGEMGAVGITFANIATNSRFAIGCIYVVRLRGHMSKALLHRLQAVCVSHPPPKRDQTWRPVHYRLPVTHKIPQLKSVSKYAAGTAADAADAGRGVLHSTISLRHRVVVHTAIRLPFSARSPANIFSGFPLSLPRVSQCPPPSGPMLALTR